MKKVLLVATVQSHICQFHRPLVEILRENNCEIHVAAKNNLAEKNGLKLNFVDKVFDVSFSRSPKSIDNFKSYFQLKKIIDEGDYNVVHCNTPMGGIVTRLAALNARKKGTRIYYTAHGFHFYKGASNINWAIYYPIEKIFSRLTDKLITITEEDYLLASKKFKCSVYRIHGVGVDEKRYFPIDEDDKRCLREKMGYSKEQKIILCIGELVPNKNQQMAIRAMREIVKKYPEAKLLIAGNGPEKEKLETLIRELKLDRNVTLVGYVINLQDYQHIADFVVSCSNREGMPLNVIETMMSKNPIILTDNRGHRELANSGKNGFIVKRNNYLQMSKYIKELCKESKKDWVKSLVENAYGFSKQYGWQKVKEELRDIYEFKKE